MIDREGVLSRLRKETERVGTIKAWAEKHDISDSYVSDVLHEKRPPGDRILKALGLEVCYRRAPRQKEPQHV